MSMVVFVLFQMPPGRQEPKTKRSHWSGQDARSCDRPALQRHMLTGNTHVQGHDDLCTNTTFAAIAIQH